MRTNRLCVALAACSLLASAAAGLRAQEEYVDLVTAAEPVAYYRFEEVDGDTVVEDSSGNLHDSLAITNAALGATGVVGNAVEFGGDATIELDLQLDMADPEGDGAGVGNDDFSIEAFVRGEVLTPPNVILSQQDGLGLGRSNLLFTQPTGSIGAYIGGATTPSSVIPEMGTWYHVVLTYDGGFGLETLRVYVNGTLVGTSGQLAEAADGNWIIGAHKSGLNSFFTGLLDELASTTIESTTRTAMTTRPTRSSRAMSTRRSARICRVSRSISCARSSMISSSSS